MTNGKTEKVYNPTLGAFFDAPEFGEDATETTPDAFVIPVTTRAGKTYNKELGTAFISMPLSIEDVANLKSIKQGDKILLRKSRKLNKNGGRTFFLENLGSNRSNKTVKAATESEI